MAKSLVDTLRNKTDKQLREMVESGWNMTIAGAELDRRGAPHKAPKVPKSTVSRGRGHARRKCGVTGGYVDPMSIQEVNLRPPVVGQKLDPWQRYAIGRG